MKHKTAKTNFVLILLLISTTVVFFEGCKKDEAPPKVKTKEEELSTIKEPQFVKQGELEFLKKDGKSVISKVEIEIADNEEKSQQGLMYRKSMLENRGMLFIFKKEEQHAFWMKNTLISLDILFVSADKEIVKIYKNTTPLSEKSLPAQKPVLYVVEVIAGYTDKYKVNEGDKINFTR